MKLLVFTVVFSSLSTWAGGFNPKKIGIEVGIFKNGESIYQKGFGYRDRGLPEQFTGSNLSDVVQTDHLLHLARGKFEPNQNTIFHWDLLANSLRLEQF